MSRMRFEAAGPRFLRSVTNSLTASNARSGKGRDGLYIRQVCPALAESLRTQFSYRLLDEAKPILERRQEGRNYIQELLQFHVPSVRVTSSDAVVLTLDFALAVK